MWNVGRAGPAEKEIRTKLPVLQLVYKLRNKVGAHQDGLKKPKGKYVEEINELFERIGIDKIETDKISNYNLAIDSVMLKIKNVLVEEILKL